MKVTQTGRPGRWPSSWYRGLCRIHRSLIAMRGSSGQIIVTPIIETCREPTLRYRLVEPAPPLASYRYPRSPKKGTRGRGGGGGNDQTQSRLARRWHRDPANHQERARSRSRLAWAGNRSHTSCGKITRKLGPEMRTCGPRKKVGGAPVRIGPRGRREILPRTPLRSPPPDSSKSRQGLLPPFP